MNEAELEIAKALAKCRHSPRKFVDHFILWGKGQLEGKSPRQWQYDILDDIGNKLQQGEITEYEAILEAVASGHGIGKSALVAWLILWAMCTQADTKGVVTANTENQLKTKTWAELAKWHKLCPIANKLFTYTATALFSKEQQREKTWRIDMVPWSERNTEAFAGLHNEGKRILLIFDEASAIPDTIWEVSEGALTDENTEIIWCAFGNPTRNTGRFKQCFGAFSHRWTRRQIDSRTVPGTNKKQLQKWIDDYGEDSDFVRVRVRGVFPRAGSMQLISSDVILSAQKSDSSFAECDPLIMAIDVARFGDDKSVIRWRRGRVARSGEGIPETEKFRGVDTMTLSGRASALIEEHHPDAVFIDETGIGGAVVDRLDQLGHDVIGVNFGSVADSDVNGEHAANKRAEIYLRLRNWLRNGGAIDSDNDLAADLEGIEYGYVDRKDMTGILLERKDDAKKRGLSSPDDGDALALTFAHHVALRPTREIGRVDRYGSHKDADFDPIWDD